MNVWESRCVVSNYGIEILREILIFGNPDELWHQKQGAGQLGATSWGARAGALQWASPHLVRGDLYLKYIHLEEI